MDLPPDGPIGLDTLYEWLVPQDLEENIRNHGIIGGISIGVGVVEFHSLGAADIIRIIL